ncbi:MAG: SRPBCC family protein [Erythrobacter sp.]|nr:SRPBCC family protein [Erythrobacter sp.]
MSDYGKLTGPDRIEFQRAFEAPIDKVWQFLVDPEKRKLWFCGGSTADHVGGEIVFEFDHRRLSESAPPEKYASEEVVTHRGEILEYDPPNRLAFTWFESAGGESSTVEISLSPGEGGVTSLYLVHTGVVGRDMLIGVLAGWHGHFDLLSEVLQGDRESDFWIRDQELEGEYASHV